MKKLYDLFATFRWTSLVGTPSLIIMLTHAVVMTCIQTKLTKLLMTSNRSIESLSYAINELIAEGLS